MIQRAPPLIQTTAAVDKVSHATHSVSLSLLHHIRQSRDLSILNIHDEGLVAKVYVIVVFFAGSTAHKKLPVM